jgi:hypothetical protein
VRQAQKRAREERRAAEERAREERWAAEEKARRALAAKRAAEEEEHLKRIERKEQAIRDKLSKASPAAHNPPPAARNQMRQRRYAVKTWAVHNSYHRGGPNEEFDSSWTTLKGATERAHVAFWEANCWGIGPDDMFNLEIQDDSGELFDQTVIDMEGGSWRVAIVPGAQRPPSRDFESEEEEEEDTDKVKEVHRKPRNSLFPLRRGNDGWLAL